MLRVTSGLPSLVVIRMGREVWVFLVRHIPVNEVELITSVKYDDSVWMKVRGERGRSALFVCCVYLPTDSSSVAVVDNYYDRDKKDVLGFREEGSVVLLGDFNARVGRSADVDDVIGLFGEDTCSGPL